MRFLSLNDRCPTFSQPQRSDAAARELGPAGCPSESLGHNGVVSVHLGSSWAWRRTGSHSCQLNRLLRENFLDDAVKSCSLPFLIALRDFDPYKASSARSKAGCGSASHVRFKGLVHTVGIDISKEQLEKNDALQEKILGDIQEYPLPSEEFDVAVCWMVLEHLPRPKDALLRIFSSLKPQGICILAIPNLLSFKGLVTKITPFWFHRRFYQFMRYKSRPFPTYLRIALVPKKIVRFAQECGFSVEFCKLIEGGVGKKLRSRFRFIDLAFFAANSSLRIISFGRAQSLFLDNCFMILRKRANV
jgi:SAM-dependent methyltransferase